MKMHPRVTLTRDPIQTLKVDAIGYGAKDTGEMGGGAAAAILSRAGPEILVAWRSKLGGATRQVGDVVVTDSFGLAAVGIRWVIHIVSIWTPDDDPRYPHLLSRLL
jgi:O-acetyl-ADP-ribose deacetylase (regulator of RNase III)